MAATPQIESSSSSADASFVGRANELAAFGRAFDRMLGGRRQILTLAGEPGIGKTRLSEALAEMAEGQGALVLWGRCYEEPGAPPYWPWVQILREFVAASSPSELLLMIGDGGSRLARLVPEIKEALGEEESDDAAPLEPGQARFGTFDAIARFLHRATDQVPLVLIIDNAHWADKASLALLEFLNQELVKSRLLVVCTYRDTEISRNNPLLSTLGELSRGAGVERLKLAGLDSASVTLLARQMLGKDLPANIIGSIDQQTDGNPLFVIELLKVLIEESRDAGVEPIAVRIPDGVRETIGRRLSRLPDDVNELLRVAAVIGRSFEGQELARVGDVSLSAALAALHLAQAAGFIEETDDVPHGYRFTHALIRETLYDEFPTLDRLRLHGLAGDALVALDPSLEPTRLSQIAHHYFESAALGSAEKAADYAERAGRSAMRLDAYEEAVIQYRNALSLLRQHDIGDVERIRQAVYWKSRAMLGTGDTDGAATLLVQSIGDGEMDGDADWLVDVLALWVIVRSDSMHVDQMPVLRRIFELLPDGDSAARAKILVAQALAERTLGSRSRIRSLVRESLAMARRIGDMDVLCHCYRSAFYALNGDPSTLDERLELSREFLGFAPIGNQNERKAEATYQYALTLIEAGHIDALERLIDDYEKLMATNTGLHEHRVRAFRVVFALLRGEYDLASTLIEELAEVGRKTRAQDADGVLGAQMFALNRDLGKLRDFAPIIERFSAHSEGRAWVPGLMLALTEVGQLERARRQLEQLSVNGFSAIPNDDMRVTSLVCCAETCAALGDAESARQLYALMLPYAGRFANHPTAVCFGSAELFLGMLAATISELETARQHFDAALKANANARAWPWLARTCYQYALALEQSGGAEDRARAESLLHEAEQLANRLGMTALAADASLKLRGQGAEEAYPDSLTAREVDVLRLIAIGRSNKDIAQVLSISLNTVATHVRNILTKTDCANRTEAAGYANRNGLTETH